MYYVLKEKNLFKTTMHHPQNHERRLHFAQWIIDTQYVPGVPFHQLICRAGRGAVQLGFWTKT